MGVGGWGWKAILSHTPSTLAAVLATQHTQLSGPCGQGISSLRMGHHYRLTTN